MCKLVDSVQENSTRVVLKCKISFWGVPTALLFLCVGAADWWPAHGWVKPVSPSSKPHSRPHLSSFHPYWVTRPPWVAESKKTHQTVPKAWTGNVKVIIGSAAEWRLHLTCWANQQQSNYKVEVNSVVRHGSLGVAAPELLSLNVVSIGSSALSIHFLFPPAPPRQWC